MENNRHNNLDMLEHGDINKLLLRFCLPSLASSLVTSVYNIVDQLFIGNSTGVLGNAATNVIFPVITLLTSLSLMIGVGASAAFNLSMGRGEEDKAHRIVGNAFFLMISFGILLTLLLLIWTKPILYMLGCTDEVYPYAAKYSRIISLGFALSIIGASGPFIIRADGSPNYALVCTVTGALLNIALDAVLVAGLHMGITGAAWATVISQAVSAAMVIAYLPTFKTFCLTPGNFILAPRLSGNLCLLGAGPAFNFLTQAVTQVMLNQVLVIYGAQSIYGAENCLAAAGVAAKVSTIGSAVVQGLTNGMQPIISYNYGKKNYRRVIMTARRVIRLILIIGFVIFLMYEFIPVQITKMFGTGSEIYYEFAAKYFRIFFMLIALNGLQSSVGGFFSAQGRPGMSILISFVRQVAFLPPLLIVLPKFFGLNGVLFSGPIADLAMALTAVFLLIREFRKLDEAAGKNDKEDPAASGGSGSADK